MSHLAMERRMRALIRKAEPALTGDAKNVDEKDALVTTLVKLVQNKRGYTELFETPEATESFAIKHDLPEAQKELLQQMQAHKDIFVPNAYLDFICTALFLAECAFICYHLWGAGLLVGFLVLMFVTDSVISRVKISSYKIGRQLSVFVHKAGLVDVDPLSGKIQMKKWTEQSWQLFAHVVFSVVEWRILSEEPWFDEPGTCWVPHPYEQAGKHRADLIVLYLAQLAIWVYTCIIHRFWDERRKDYFVMYVHHIVTIMLVAGSFAAGYLRVGLVVLWIHDVSDILVDLLKMVNYLKLEARKGLFASELAYFACIVGWVYWRLYQFPGRAIRASLIESYRLHAAQPRSAGDTFFGVAMRDLPLYFEMNALLLTLLALHIYWAHLFFMIGYRILTESAREASRQEYEGDSDDETTAAARLASPKLAGSPAGAGRRRGGSTGLASLCDVKSPKASGSTAAQQLLLKPLPAGLASVLSPSSGPASGPLGDLDSISVSGAARGEREQGRPAGSAVQRKGGPGSLSASSPTASDPLLTAAGEVAAPAAAPVSRNSKKGGKR